MCGADLMASLQNIRRIGISETAWLLEATSLIGEVINIFPAIPLASHVATHWASALVETTTTTSLMHMLLRVLLMLLLVMLWLIIEPRLSIELIIDVRALKK